MQELFLTDYLHYDVTPQLCCRDNVSHTFFLPLTSSTFLYFMVFYQNSFPPFYFDITVLTISFAILPP